MSNFPPPPQELPPPPDEVDGALAEDEENIRGEETMQPIENVEQYQQGEMDFVDEAQGGDLTNQKSPEEYISVAANTEAVVESPPHEVIITSWTSAFSKIFNP